VAEDKRNPSQAGSPADPASGSELEDLYRGLQPEMRRPVPSHEAMAAALEAVQRLAAEVDAEQAADDTAHEQSPASNFPTTACRVCGYNNRQGNKFCAMCGLSIEPQESDFAVRHQPERSSARPLDLPASLPDLQPVPEMTMAPPRNAGPETHHYHHHYHHHYFPGGMDATAPRYGGDAARVEPGREVRPTAALRGDMSRAEAAVRAVTHEWVLACNTKHLDDLLDLYVPDALVLRSNTPPIRGAAAIREFFFGALDAGLGEVEIEPLRVEVVGDLAYEAGRCKALIPSAMGKRREERGKYLWVCARQSNGEWKLSADCWSSDLTLSSLESEIPQSTGVKTALPRKNP